MEEFKQYYKFPLKMWDISYIKVFTDDNKMAFDWLLPLNEKYNNIRQRHLDKINGIETNIPREGVLYIYKDGQIIAKVDNNEEVKIARIRGWGMLTGTGGYNLSVDKAVEIQDAFAEYCIKMLNKK